MADSILWCQEIQTQEQNTLLVYTQLGNYSTVFYLQCFITTLPHPLVERYHNRTSSGQTFYGWKIAGTYSGTVVNTMLVHITGIYLETIAYVCFLDLQPCLFVITGLLLAEEFWGLDCSW